MTQEFKRPSDEAYAQWIRRVVRRSRQDGRSFISLFDSSVPEPVELLRETIAEGFSRPLTSRYTSAFSGGNPYVLDLLAARHGVSREQVICTTGATGALALLYRAFTRPGDHVLVETPGFDLFTDLAKAQHLGVSSFARTGARYEIDVDAVMRAALPNTRLIVVSNLHNPSGMVTSQQSLVALAEAARKKNIHVIVDEVYGDYAEAAVRPKPAACLAPNLITINSVTKIYGLATLRCGWIVAAPEVMAVVRELSDRTEFGISNLSHAVAALVLENSAPFDAFSADMIAAARPVLERYYSRWQAEGLVEGLLPDAGCIFFPRLVGIADSYSFSEWLAAEYQVIVAPGEYFDAPGHIRIGFGKEAAQLEHGLDRLESGLRRWREGV